MEAVTKKRLQELGAFALAGAGKPHHLCEMAEMIRATRDYRFVGIYKVDHSDFVIVARTGTCPPAYPRFPTTQGLAGAALESKKAIMVADVHKDPRYLPTFGSTQSEIVVPVVTESEKVVGLIDVESEKLDAFTAADRDFLEHAAFVISRVLK
jgi:L-methionine (R)-S-oxide reductase